MVLRDVAIGGQVQLPLAGALATICCVVTPDHQAIVVRKDTRGTMLDDCSSVASSTAPCDYMSWPSSCRTCGHIPGQVSSLKGCMAQSGRSIWYLELSAARNQAADLVAANKFHLANLHTAIEL